MDGIFLVNKKASRTSHDEVFRIKRALRSIGDMSKVGHSGTLDPKVTGLLVVGVGKGTRVLEYMLLSEKRYTGVIEFHAQVTREGLEKVIKEFTGVIKQLPPVKSSVKRIERDREVYNIMIKEFDVEHGRYAVLDCAVERGTYIRKLFHDMGQSLGCGAHMGDLHRTHVGSFCEDDGIIDTDTLALLIQKTTSRNPYTRKKSRDHIHSIMKPVRSAVDIFPHVILHPEIETYLSSGSDLFVPGVATLSEVFLKGDTVGVYTSSGILVALGVAGMDSVDIVKKDKGVAVVTKKILI